MKNLLLSVVAFFIGTIAVLGLPPVQHSVVGVVRGVKVEKGGVVVAPEKEGDPSEFVVVPARTKLWRDKKPAELANLAEGQKVQIYYRLEVGQNVAVEISWTTTTSVLK